MLWSVDVRVAPKAVIAKCTLIDDVELIGLDKFSDGSCRLDCRAFAAFVGTRPLLLGGVLHFDIAE
jgi:hypothetical protein